MDDTEIYAKLMVNDLEATYKYYSSKNSKELIKGIPSRIRRRKANMIAYHLNFTLDFANYQYISGETQGYKKPDNSPSTQQIVRSSLKKIIPADTYDLLHLKNICFYPATPSSRERGLYFAQRALLVEIMRKKTAVIDIYVIKHINSFLTDYDGDVGILNPLLYNITNEYKPPTIKKIKKLKKLTNFKIVGDFRKN